MRREEKQLGPLTRSAGQLSLAHLDAIVRLGSARGAKPPQVDSFACLLARWPAGVKLLANEFSRRKSLEYGHQLFRARSRVGRTIGEELKKGSCAV